MTPEPGQGRSFLRTPASVAPPDVRPLRKPVRPSYKQPLEGAGNLGQGRGRAPPLHSTERSRQTLVASCWVLRQRICCFPKHKSFSPSLEPRGGRELKRPLHPTLPYSPRLPLQVQDSRPWFPHPQPGGALLPEAQPLPSPPRRGLLRNGCLWAPGPLRRVCGLDEFTLPSIPKYDPIWGRRNPVAVCGRM